LEILLIEGTALEIALGELQTFEGYVIQVARERLIVKGKLCLVSGFRCAIFRS
jgi:hypothetical protein